MLCRDTWGWTPAGTSGAAAEYGDDVKLDGKVLAAHPTVDALIAYILHEIIRGLEYAHRQHPPSLASHILHRNLSPNNILLGFQGNIKIQGFSTKV